MQRVSSEARCRLQSQWFSFLFFFFKPHNSISMVFHVTCLLVNFLGIQDGLEILFTAYVLVTPRENVPKVQKKNADQV